MYKIVYENNIENKIITFIDWYKKRNLDTFSYTGLFYEEIIRESYINNTKKFKKDIFDWIEKSLNKEKILWYKILENNNYKISLTVWNHRLFIEYFEDEFEKSRFIINLNIFSK